MKKIIKIILVITLLIQYEVKALYQNNIEIINEFNTQKYQIKLNGNGGTFSEQNKIIILKKHMTLPTPNKKGYEFSHYSTIDADYNNEIDDVEKINNKELFAKWKTSKYQIIYDLDGGVLDKKIEEYTIEDEFVLPIPVKQDSEFLGWTINNGNNIEKELKVMKGTTGDLYLKAHWKQEKYKISTKSIIDGIEYENGKDYYTFYIWINDKLEKKEYFSFEEEFEKGTKIKIKTIPKEGLNTNYEETIIVEKNYIFKPEWVTNEYIAEFYLDGYLAEITKNKYGTKVKTPTIEIKWFGYDKNFYYISGFNPRQTWYQPAYTIYFDTVIDQYTCMSSFGSTHLSNAYYQLDILRQHGINYCKVNESWNAVECYAKAIETLNLYNNIWNILPYSGNGYSRYKQMSCDSGYMTSYNR